MQALFLNATAVDWKVGEAIAGQVKSAGGFSFITIEGAGHQVPMDQPVNVSLTQHSKLLCSVLLYVSI